MGDDLPREKTLSPDGLWTGHSLPVATTIEFVKLDLRPAHLSEMWSFAVYCSYVLKTTSKVFFNRKSVMCISEEL
jgi:hypothetical protein